MLTTFAMKRKNDPAIPTAQVKSVTFLLFFLLLKVLTLKFRAVPVWPLWGHRGLHRKLPTSSEENLWRSQPKIVLQRRDHGEDWRDGVPSSTLSRSLFFLFQFVMRLFVWPDLFVFGNWTESECTEECGSLGVLRETRACKENDYTMNYCQDAQTDRITEKPCNRGICPITIAG